MQQLSICVYDKGAITPLNMTYALVAIEEILRRAGCHIQLANDKTVRARHEKVGVDIVIEKEE